MTCRRPAGGPEFWEQHHTAGYLPYLPYLPYLHYLLYLPYLPYLPTRSRRAGQLEQRGM